MMVLGEMPFIPNEKKDFNFLWLDCSRKIWLLPEKAIGEGAISVVFCYINGLINHHSLPSS
jgi:hypothetical protein